MKNKKIILLILLLIVPILSVNAAGSISLSTSSMTIEVGKSATFTIKANNSAGRVDISSSNTAVAKVSASSKFLDSSSAKITVTAKKEGTATINVKLTDVATYDGKVLKGTKTIKVTVKKASVKKTTTEKKTVVKKEEPKKMNIKNINIVGYPIKFESNKLEYEINVDEKVEELYIIVSGENFAVTGDKKVNIKGKDKIDISFKDSSETKTYSIKINRIKKEECKETKCEEKKCEQIKCETNKINVFMLILCILFFLSTVILIYKVILDKKAIERNMNN